MKPSTPCRSRAGFRADQASPLGCLRAPLLILGAGYPARHACMAGEQQVQPLSPAVARRCSGLHIWLSTRRGGFDSRTGRVWNHGRRVRRRIGDPVGSHGPCRFESCWFRCGMWSSGHDVGVPCRRRGFESRHPDHYRCPIAQRQSDTLLRWGCRFESCWGSGPAGLPAGPFGTMAEW